MGIKSRLEEAEEQISKLEDRIMGSNQACLRVREGRKE